MKFLYWSFWEEINLQTFGVIGIETGLMIKSVDKMVVLGHGFADFTWWNVLPHNLFEDFL